MYFPFTFIFTDPIWIHNSWSLTFLPEGSTRRVYIKRQIQLILRCISKVLGVRKEDSLDAFNCHKFYFSQVDAVKLTSGFVFHKKYKNVSIFGKLDSKIGYWGEHEDFFQFFWWSDFFPVTTKRSVGDGPQKWMGNCWWAESIHFFTDSVREVGEVEVYFLEIKCVKNDILF